MSTWEAEAAAYERAELLAREASARRRTAARNRQSLTGSPGQSRRTTPETTPSRRSRGSPRTPGAGSSRGSSRSPTRRGPRSPSRLGAGRPGEERHRDSPRGDKHPDAARRERVAMQEDANAQERQQEAAPAVLATDAAAAIEREMSEKLAREVTLQEPVMPTVRPTRSQRREFRDRAVIEAAFRAFDLDGSGYIEKKELRAVAKELGQALSNQELQALVEEMDTDQQDGRISLKEFTDWWLREYSYSGFLDWLNKSASRMWLKIRSAAAEPAPVSRNGIGWGCHFGWKALTSAKSSLTTAEVTVNSGWTDESEAAGSVQLSGEKMPKQDYQEQMEELHAPSSSVAVVQATLRLRESSSAEDVQALQRDLQAVLALQCATLSETLIASAPDFGLDLSPESLGNPSRGGGVSLVTLQPQVRPTGQYADEGPQEHSLDIIIFAGGLLLESAVATCAKAGLTFTDFPSFSLELSSTSSLRGMVASGAQHLFSSLGLQLSVSWSARKRLVRKLMGLAEVESAAAVALGTMMTAMTGAIELQSLGTLLAEAGSPLLSDTEGTGPMSLKPKVLPGSLDQQGEEEDWRHQLQGLTGQQLKLWLRDASARLDGFLHGQGAEDDRRVFALLKRLGLSVPRVVLYAVGSKVVMLQPDENPLWSLDTFMNPDLADITRESES